MGTNSTALLLVAFATGDVAGVSDESAPASSSPALIVDLDLVGRFSASAKEPETSLLYDADTELWRVADWLAPRASHAYPSFVAIFGIELEPTNGLELRLLVDSGELRPGGSFDPPLAEAVSVDGREVVDGLLSLTRIRELALSWRRGPLTLEVGRFSAIVASSLAYDDFGTGGRAAISLEALGLGPWQIEATAVMTGHSFDELDRPSPLCSLRLDYELSLFERLGGFAAVFFDRNGVFHDSLTSMAAEGFIALSGPLQEQVQLTRLFLSERSTRGHLVYLGVDGNLLPADGLSLKAQGAVALGTLWVGPEELRREIDVRGWAAAAEATYGLLPELGVSLFGMALSGDEPPTQLGATRGQYHAFLAVAPYWTWTGLFFSGGLSQGLFPARANAAGINGHGVLGGGSRASWVWRDWQGEATLAGLWPMAAPLPSFGGGGRAYGVEADLVSGVTLLDGLTGGVELDLFWPGGFFVERTMAYRFLGMVRAHVGN
jgi:hypothetical protein